MPHTDNAVLGEMRRATQALVTATSRLKAVLASDQQASKALTINPREATVAKTKAQRGIAGILKPFLSQQGKALADQTCTAYVRHKALQPDRRKDPTAEDELQKQAEAIVDAVAIDWSELAASVRKYLQQAATAGVAQAGTALDSEHDIFSQANDWAIQYGRDRGAELVGMKYVDGALVVNPSAEWAITDTTRDKLKALVVRALEEGTPVNDLRKQIQESTAFSSSRAQMIATTEVNFANAGGQVQVGKVVGHTSKRSLLSGDHVVSDSDLTCDVNAAESVQGIPINEVFPSDDMYSPFHPNCVCLTQTFTPGKEL